MQGNRSKGSASHYSYTGAPLGGFLCLAVGPFLVFLVFLLLLVFLILPGGYALSLGGALRRRSALDRPGQQNLAHLLSYELGIGVRFNYRELLL